MASPGHIKSLARCLRPSLIHDPETLARYEPRIKQIARMDLIGQAVTRAIHER